MFRNAIPSFNICPISVIRGLITVPFDDDSDDDGVLNVCDEISSFGFYDDNVNHHQKNNDVVMTILPSPLMTPPLERYILHGNRLETLA